MELSDSKKREYVKRLLLSRMRILANNGFYGLLLMHMEFALDEDCKTAATNGSKIIFAPDFLDRISDKELDFILMHEILHVVLQHCFRGGVRDNYDFNIACDIVVNSNILLSCGMDRDSITLSRFGESMHVAPDGVEGYEYTAEQVYEMLLRRRKRPAKGNGVWDDHSRWAESGKMSDLWKQRLINADKAIKLMGGEGLIPKCAERILTSLRRPQTDWRTILNDFVQEEVTDYSFTPPDRRQDGSGFYLPDYNDRDIAVSDILFMIDTSGSISDDMVTAAYSEVLGATEQFGGKIRGWLGFFDAGVDEVRPFESAEDIKEIKPVGGGGTRFDVIFDHVRDNMQGSLPACIIILTDGYAEFPSEDKAMGIPVLWLVSTTVTPPWGRVVRMEGSW